MVITEVACRKYIKVFLNTFAFVRLPIGLNCLTLQFANLLICPCWTKGKILCRWGKRLQFNKLELLGRFACKYEYQNVPGLSPVPTP